jgi:hypothetical protein
MRRLAGIAGAAGLLAVPLLWLWPLASRLGTDLCLAYSLPLALSLFAYYLIWGWGVSWLGRRAGRASALTDLLIYVNLPLTLVYLYRATEWSRALTCG